MMDRLSIQAAEQATGAGYRLDAGAALLVELDGPREECEARFEQLDRALLRRRRDRGPDRPRRAERALMWQTRKAAFAAMGRIAPAYYVQDGVIPRTRLAEVLRQIDALAAEYGLARRQRLPRRRRQPAPAGLLRLGPSRARPSAPRSLPG